MQAGQRQVLRVQYQSQTTNLKNDALSQMRITPRGRTFSRCVRSEKGVSTYRAGTQDPLTLETPLLKCPLYFTVGLEEGLDGIADMRSELPGPEGFRGQSKNRPANLSSKRALASVKI